MLRSVFDAAVEHRPMAKAQADSRSPAVHAIDEAEAAMPGKEQFLSLPLLLAHMQQLLAMVLRFRHVA